MVFSVLRGETGVSPRRPEPTGLEVMAGPFPPGAEQLDVVRVEERPTVRDFPDVVVLEARVDLDLVLVPIPGGLGLEHGPGLPAARFAAAPGALPDAPLDRGPAGASTTHGGYVRTRAL